MDCHGAARLAMTGMVGVAVLQAFATMPKILVIASEARQSTGRTNCHRVTMVVNQVFSSEFYPSPSPLSAWNFSGVTIRNFSRSRR
jgi:hypothetical protein